MVNEGTSVLGGDQDNTMEDLASLGSGPGYPTEYDPNAEEVSSFVQDFEEEVDETSDSDNLDENISDSEESNDTGEETTDAEIQSARYFQSELDKTKAAYEKLQEEHGNLARNRGLIEAIENDPKAAQLLMNHFSGQTQQEAPKAEPLKAPRIPEDFDPSLAYTPGTPSYDYREAHESYLIARATEETTKRAGEQIQQQLAPFQQERQKNAQRQQLENLLRQTDLPPDQYNAFIQERPYENMNYLVEAFKIKNGLIQDQKVETNKKKEELERIAKNSGKPTGGRKKGGQAKPKSESAQFMEGLRNVVRQTQF